MTQECAAVVRAEVTSELCRLKSLVASRHRQLSSPQELESRVTAYRTAIMPHVEVGAVLVLIFYQSALDYAGERVRRCAPP